MSKRIEKTLVNLAEKDIPEELQKKFIAINVNMNVIHSSKKVKNMMKKFEVN